MGVGFLAAGQVGFTFGGPIAEDKTHFFFSYEREKNPLTLYTTTHTPEFNIDLETSFIIGDSFRDIQAGRNAGLATIGVATGQACKDSDMKPDYYYNSLNEAVAFIIKSFGA